MTALELREWMALHGFSVRRLASSLGVNPGTVQRWRDGTHEPPPYLPRALDSLSR